MRHYYNEFFDIGQEVIRFNLYQLGLPADDPVYTLKSILEVLNFSKLLENYSNKGRKGFNPIMMFAVILYANMRGIRAVDRIVELCQRDLAFIWLTKGEKPKRDAFYDFINNKLTQDVLDDLHYQFVSHLKQKGFVTLEALYIDGTKIEANANRYTFVWRGSINYHLANLLDSIDALYTKYNAFIEVHNYQDKYTLAKEQMFIIEGMDKVRETIEKNRQRKLTKHKKLSNNSIIEIDNICPYKLIQLMVNLTRIAEAEGIVFTAGKGCKKSELQALYEEIEACGYRLCKYQEYFEIMGSTRNSFSKTDVESTFMRMKDDHMLNGQLKPAYNVQIAVENYFIIHTYISDDRTDYNTLIPIMKKHHKVFNRYPKEVTADSGYCSEKNLCYLKAHEIKSYIKLQTHEQMKTRAYQNDIGKHYNMKLVIHEDTNYYICHDGRQLEHVRTENSTRGEFTRSKEVYACKECSGCLHKAECLYKYNPETDDKRNKIMKINEHWEELKAESHENIQSERGILNRKIRSIQTEGHFGDIKENDGFKRFNHRSSEKVQKEFSIYALGRNLNKYHRFITGKIDEYTEKTGIKTA